MGRERYYTVWMGDLPPGIKRGHVKDFFEEYGPLGGIRLMNNFGFIDFRKKRDAKEAVKDLDGKKLKGARIRLEHSDGPGGSKKKGEDYDAVNFPPIGGQSSMVKLNCLAGRTNSAFSSTSVRTGPNIPSAFQICPRDSGI